MIQNSYILALSQQSFVTRQVSRVFSGGPDVRRDSFWRGWGFGEA